MVVMPDLLESMMNYQNLPQLKNDDNFFLIVLYFIINITLVKIYFVDILFRNKR